VRRGPRVLLYVAATLAIAVTCWVGVTVAFFLGNFSDFHANAAVITSTTTTPLPPGACGQGAVDPAGDLPTIASLTSDQVHNAAIIVHVGQNKAVPPRGWVIAVATALQESRLYNLPYLGKKNDHDSLGLFQQRPSMGWGTPAQIMDPVYATTKFYDKLVKVKGWQTLPLTVAAQRVQRSAFPDAYAKHEPLATQIVNTLTGGAARATGSLVDLTCNSGSNIAASGWTVPVVGRITSGFRTPQRPTHNGVDLAAPRGTAIHAAAAGVVTFVGCEATTLAGQPYSCDKDGGPQYKGCGWYVQIAHAGGIITRYCHMVSRPIVTIGQLVAAGQPIGYVGMSGDATGPHCHFEVHINGDGSAAGAIDPVPFMNQQGAPVGVRA